MIEKSNATVVVDVLEGAVVVVNLYADFVVVVDDLEGVVVVVDWIPSYIKFTLREQTSLPTLVLNWKSKNY